MTSSSFPEDELAAIDRVVALLEQFSSAYCVGGSVASGIHGEVRATNDIDIVVDFSERGLDDFLSQLGSDFYVDRKTAFDSFRSRRSFNIIHMATVLKFDLFPPDEIFGQEELRRAERIAFAGLTLPPRICSVEDTILAKLRWYRGGGHVSELQWKDIAGMISINREKLDLRYLREWAEKAQLSELLEEALTGS